MSDRSIQFTKNMILSFIVLICSLVGSSVRYTTQSQPSSQDQMPALTDETILFIEHDPGGYELEPAPLDLSEPLEPESETEPEPVSEPESEPEPEFFTIAMMGDCTFASEHNARSGSQAYEKIIGDNYAYPFSGVKHLYENADFVMVNLECAISDSDVRAETSFHFRAEPKYVNILLEGGIDFVALGNNHTLDYGQKGYEDTQEILLENGIGYAPNGGWNLFTTDSDLVIGVYSRNFPNDTEVVRAVEQMREAGAQLIIMALHWGDEGSYRANSWQSAIGRAAIDAGAHIIMGTHPHTLQKLEEYNGGYIYYSLGNWSFGGHTNPRDKDSVIAMVNIMRDLDGSLSIIGVDNIPCSVSGSTTINDYRPVPYELESLEYERTLSKLDGSFTGPDLVVSYDSPVSEESSSASLATQEESMQEEYAEEDNTQESYG